MPEKENKTTEQARAQVIEAMEHAKLGAEVMSAVLNILFPPSMDKWTAMSEAKRIEHMQAGAVSPEQWVWAFEHGSKELQAEAAHRHDALLTLYAEYRNKLRSAPRSQWADIQKAYEAELKGLKVIEGFSFKNIIREVVSISIFTAKMATPTLNIDLTADVDTFIEAVKRERPEWNITDDVTLADIGQLSTSAYMRLDPDEIQRRLSIAGQPTRATRQREKRLRTAPLAKDGLMRFPSDYISKAVIESLAPKAMRELSSEFLQARGIYAPAFWQAYPFEESSKRRGSIKGAIGFTQKPATDPANAIWDAIQQNGALTIKVQFALWALAYAETNAEPGKFITVSIPDLCDKLGYKRQKQTGAHKLENKQAAMEALEYLTGLQVAVIYRTPKGKVIQLDGPLWNRGMRAQQRNEYGDLFGANRVPGTRAMWDPIAFRYAPGDFFNDAEWREHNKDIALIGEGIMQLSASNTDKWAVMVSGYLATLAKMNGYRPRTIKAITLLQKTGLWEERARPKRMFEHLDKALSRAVEVGVIKSCKKVNDPDMKPGIDYDDLDSPETLDALRDKTPYSEKARQVYLIEWTDTLAARAPRLRAAQEKHIAKAEKRASKRKHKDASGGSAR